ncbi:MAG: hypothetical protein H6642_01430 [Caldilineaceae bacterium]|nr:hypothetical protein [Caldilineaceae bacterium]
MSKFKRVEHVEEMEALAKSGQSTTVVMSQVVHDHYLKKALAAGLPESKLSGEEVQNLASKGLKLKGKVYFAVCDCPNCKRVLDSYDFILTGVEEHGLKMVQTIFNNDEIIAQVNPRLTHITCSNCGTRTPMQPPARGATSSRYFWTMLYACVEESD